MCKCFYIFFFVFRVGVTLCSFIDILEFDNEIEMQGVANRGASVRVGRETEKEGKGYFEDRRPASNMDPYVVTSLIAETTILWKP